MASPAGAPTREAVAFGVVLLVAALLRLGGLGRPPLSPEEASSAVVAWGVARGEGAPATSDPAWSHMSPLLASAQLVLFGVLGGSGEAAARLPSALAGMALVALPVFLRRRIGAETAFCLATLIALDPVCVETSRRADGTAMGALLAAAALVGPLRGPALGLLLVAGSAAWSLLPVVALASLLGLGRRPGARVKGAVGIAATAALLGASGLLVAWDLIGGVSTSLTTWLGAWSSPVESTRVYRLGVVPPLALGLGVIGLACLARARRFSAVAVLAASLAWTVRLAVRPGGDPAAALLAVLLLTAAAVPAIHEIRRRLAGGGGRVEPRMLAAAALLLALAVPGLVRTARVLGGDATPARSAGVGLLAGDVMRFSSERAGDAHELPVEVLCQPRPDPLLRWALREARYVRFHSGSLDPEDTGPALVIGPDPSPDPSSVGEGPCDAPRGRAGARYRSGTRSVVLWVPLER